MGFFFSTRQDKYGIAAAIFFFCANWHDIPKISFYTKLLFVYCQDIGFSLEFASPTGEKIVSSIVISLLYSNLVASDFTRSLINLHRPFLSSIS